MHKLVESASEAQSNIRTYQTEIMSEPQLARRAVYVRGWYADRSESDEWFFAPSKFIGIRDSSAKRYLLESGKGGQRDGRETENLLRAWFTEVDPNTRLGEDLFAALRGFLARYDVVPNKRARINLPKDVTAVRDERPLSAGDQGSLLERITANPDVCGGRPVIRGTRMRVVDIVEAFAHGMAREQILTDFDYLTEDDIAAALLYAARATDHRVVRTA